jgi:predicted nucleic acid-binding protein
VNVLVDTSVWSLALRRRAPRGTSVERELTELIGEGRVLMLGAIRQELLSSIRTIEQFKKLRDSLRSFPDEPLSQEDYEDAANCFNRCRVKGVQGSNTDFLLCAVALRRSLVVDVKAIGAHRRKDTPDSIDDVRWQQHRVVRPTYRCSAAGGRAHASSSVSCNALLGGTFHRWTSRTALGLPATPM